MRKIIVSHRGIIKRNETYPSMSIEEKLERKMEGETVDISTKNLDYAYGKAGDGVLYGTDIRGDRMEMLQTLNDAVERKREAKTIDFLKIKEEKEKKNKEPKSGENPGQPTAGE